MLPYFRYHPDPLATGSFRELGEAVRCPCCGERTSVVYRGPFYSVEEVHDLCPGGIAGGSRSTGGPTVTTSVPIWGPSAMRI